MDLKIIEILKEINSEEHLNLLLPNKLSNSLKTKGLNLYQICLLTEEDFGKIHGLGKTKYKYLIEFNSSIEQNPSIIMLFKKHILNGELIAPKYIDPNYSLAKKIHLALLEFINIVDEKKNLTLKNDNIAEKSSFEIFAEYIDLYFAIRNEDLLDFSQIAQKYSKTTENIRSTLFYHRNRTDLVDLFLNNEIGYNIKINPIINNEILNFISQNIYKPFKKDLFTNNEDYFSEDQIKRFFELYDHRLEIIEFENSDYIYSTILKKDEKVLFKSHFRVLDLVLKTGNKLTYDELYNECIKTIDSFDYNQTNRYIKDNGLNTNMFNIILDEYIKIETIEEDDNQLYQFKWHYLSTIVAKCTRILFENGEVMSKKEILEEFQSRENELGIELTIDSINFLHIRATDKIHPIGKTGNWLYDENHTTEKNSLALKVNEDIEKKFNGKIYINEFLEYVNTNDFYRNYEASSIRANVFLCSKQAINDSNLFIHNNFKDQYPEIELKGNRNKYLGNTIIKKLVQIFDDTDQPIEKNDLVQLLDTKLQEDDITIKIKNNILQYLIKFFDLGVIIKFEKENKIFFQLDKEELSTHDIEKIGKKQEPLYKTSIRSKAITFLKEKNKAKLSEVFELIRPLAPLDISINNIYKIFDNDTIFIKEKVENETWIYLNTPQLPAPQEMHVEVEEETTELLGTTPLQRRVHFDTIELKRAVIDELILEKNTYGLNQEIIFGTFESFIEIVLNNDRNSIWGKTLVQSIYESFCTKTDFYDRHMCVMNLIGSYETFLKMISPIEQNGRATGIVEIIHTIPEIKELYHYKNQEKIRITDRQKNNFSHILNKAKYLADLYRHDRSHEDLSMGNSKMMKSIVDFTALYLYTLYLVDRY